MKTIGYGLVQIPIVRQYRLCCCIKRSLAAGVVGTGWQEIIASTIRIILLSSWGLQSVDYTLPQTNHKMIGVYFEFALLGFLFANGLLVLLAMWSNNLFLLYPSLGVIPLSFVTDVIIKATCYAALFLTPEVTSFGILSLVEVWFRGLSLMYGWIVIISYIYYKRKEGDPGKVEVQLNTRSPSRVSAIVRRTSSQTPFSRRSSLSQRGRHSFLIRKSSKKEVKVENEIMKKEQQPVQSAFAGNAIALNSFNNPSEHRTAKGGDLDSLNTSGYDQANSSSQTNGFSKDSESEILLGESATMSMRRNPVPRTNHGMNGESGPIVNEHGRRPIFNSAMRSPSSKYKTKGGFVPMVLRTPSNVGSQEKSEQLMLLKAGVRLQQSPVSSYSGSATTADTIEFDNSFLTRSPIAGKGKDSSKQVGPTSRATGKGPNTRTTLLSSRELNPKNATTWDWKSPGSKKGSQASQTGSTSSPLLTKHIPEPVLV